MFKLRVHFLRFDMWLCLLLSFGIAYGASKIVNNYLEDKYEDHMEEHKVEENNVGGIATEDIFRAQNIEDLLSHDTFTVISPGIEYKNKGAGFYKNFYMYALTLPSGEKVAARINFESVIKNDEDIYSKSDSILPVGKIIKEDLTLEKTFLEQIEYKEPLDRKDFYIDMVGEAAIQSRESFIEGPVILIELLIIAILFPIFHMIGSKLGIFPYIFPPKKLQKNEWD